MSKRSIVSMQSSTPKNKCAQRFFGKRFHSSVLFCIACVVAGGSIAWAQVKLETQKPRYNRTEAVTLVMANGLAEDIFSAAAGSDSDLAVVNFEKRKNQWVWDAFPVRCPRLECPGQKQAELPALKVVPSGQQVNFLWKPRIYKDKTRRLPESGVYRITVIYQKRVPSDPQRTIWATVKSNEFILE